MRFAQIVFSPTGGTQRVADAITEVWGNPVDRVDLSNPGEDFSKVTFEEEDLVLAAVPSYGGRVPELAARRLGQIHGGRGQCVIVCVYGNRAYEDTLVELHDFSEKILEKLKHKDAESGGLTIPGNRPYKKAGGAGLVPKADKKCVGCGLCARDCPAQAISRDHIKTAETGKCISCMRCVVRCPESARKVNGAMVSAAALAMKKVCSVKKGNELYSSVE